MTASAHTEIRPHDGARAARGGLIRPFERGDAADVARLFDRAFRKGPGRASPRLVAFIEEVFCDAPCQISSPLRSFVYQDDAGGVGGFVGTHPRSFALDGRPISGAAYGQLMVVPELRGQGIAMRLVEQFYRGGQEFSFCTSAAPVPRAINGRLGGINPPVRGLSWRKTLRPGKLLARRLSRARKLGPLRHLAGHFISDPTGQTESGASLESAVGAHDWPDLGAIETVCMRASTCERFHPLFESDHVSWKLRVAAAADGRRTFARIVDVGKGPIGWHVWFLASDGAATVLEMRCAAGGHDIVVGELLRHARAMGAESISGLCNDATHADALRLAGATIWQAPSTFVFHSNNPGLLKAFPNGPQHLSVFDGEGWLAFPR